MKEYQVDINGVEHTFQYSDEDAKRLGLKAGGAADAKQADAPANKARKPQNKAK